MPETSEAGALISFPLPVHTRLGRSTSLGNTVVQHLHKSTAETKRSYTAHSEHPDAPGNSARNIMRSTPHTNANRAPPQPPNTSVPFLDRPYSCISAASAPTPHAPRSNTPPDKGKNPLCKSAANPSGRISFAPVLRPTTTTTATTNPSASIYTKPTATTAPPLRTSLEVRTHLSQNRITDVAADVHALTLLSPYRYNLRLEILKAQQKRKDSLWMPYLSSSSSSSSSSPSSSSPEAAGDEKRGGGSYGNKYLAELQRRRRMSDASSGTWLEEGWGGLARNDAVGVWKPRVGRSCFSRVLVLIGMIFVVVVVLAVVVTQVVEKNGN